MWANGGPGNNLAPHVKRAVKARQRARCAVYNPRVCTGTLDEYDHILNTAATGTPRDQATADDIQGLCRPCHNAKTQREAVAARRARRADRGGRSKMLRTPQPHPGLTGT